MYSLPNLIAPVPGRILDTFNRFHACSPSNAYGSCDCRQAILGKAGVPDDHKTGTKLHLRRQTAKREQVADRPVGEGHVRCSEIIEASCRAERVTALWRNLGVPPPYGEASTGPKGCRLCIQWNIIRNHTDSPAVRVCTVWAVEGDPVAVLQPLWHLHACAEAPAEHNHDHDGNRCQTCSLCDPQDILMPQSPHLHTAACKRVSMQCHTSQATTLACQHKRTLVQWGKVSLACERSTY